MDDEQPPFPPNIPPLGEMPPAETKEPETQETDSENEEEQTGVGSALENAHIYHADIDSAAYQELAHKNMWDLVEGNGVKREDIEITEFKGETLEFITVTMLEMKSKVADKRQPGKLTGMRLVGSEAQFREALKKEINKITHSQDTIKRIKETILLREDKGFGLEGEFIRMPFLHKDWVIHEPCNPCHAKGKINCTYCHAKGSVTCPHCNGNGTETCPNCNGRQYMQGANGQQQQCMHCNGTGRKSCHTCHQQRTIQCPKCKGAAVITCKQCNGHAWTSRIFMAEIDVVANFKYDPETLPEKIVYYIEELGHEFPQHVEFRPVIMGREHQRDIISLPYQIRAPNANLTFTIKTMEVPAYMFGTQGIFSDTPPFLEKITVKGIKHLLAAGAGKGDVSAHLIAAGQYKTLRHIIMATSKLSPAKALLATQNKYYVGLSEEITKKLVMASHKGMSKITNMPRQIGLILGSGIASALYGAHFYNLRPALMKAIPTQPPLHIMADGLISIAGIALSIYTIKAFAGFKVHKTLSALMKNTKRKMNLARAGKHANWATAIALIAFLAIAFTTLQTTAPTPSWMQILYQTIHPFIR